MTPHTPAAAQDEAPHFEIEPLADGEIFRIRRGARLNALTKPALLGLAACIDRLEAKKLPLLVITGEGTRAFCAGTDLAELQTLSEEDRQNKSAMARALLVRLSRSRLISVAALNGLAFGGGLELAMGCTFRVAASHVLVSLPEIKLGVIPAYAGTQFLPALVGQARALDMMLTGRQVPAAEALAMGLLTRVVEPGVDVLTAALELGRQVAGFSPTAIDGIRRCVDAAGAVVTDAGLAVEDAVVRSVFNDDNAREGVAAFLQKRPPNFRR